MNLPTLYPKVVRPAHLDAKSIRYRVKGNGAHQPSLETVDGQRFHHGADGRRHERAATFFVGAIIN